MVFRYDAGVVGAKDADRLAVIVDDLPPISYLQLEEEVATLARKLPKKELFFLIGGNDMPSLVCYLASLKCGAVPLLLGENIPGEQLNRLIQIYDPHFVFLSESVRWNPHGSTEEWRLGEYIFYRRDRAASKVLHQDLALLLATSGSTGSPKLVRLSLRNIISNAESIIQYLGITVGERAITSLPFNYSYGLSVINSHLLAGASLVLTKCTLMDKKFWQQVNNHSVTSFAGVPYSYDILLKLRFSQMHLPSLKTLTQAGGRLESSKMKQMNEICREKGIQFFPMYGQTEATARMAYLTPEKANTKLGSIGKSIPGGELWLEHENGKRISSSEIIGELIYKGANVSLGYAECEADLALGDLNQGVLRTGDLARRDEDGYFFIEGRRHRFLKIFGIRVSLDAVEEIGFSRGWICAAHGVDDRLVLFSVEPTGFSPQEMSREMAFSLGIHPSAISVYMIPELPRLNTGKVDYQCLSQMI